jgi:hypothetical protein
MRWLPGEARAPFSISERQDSASPAVRNLLAFKLSRPTAPGIVHVDRNSTSGRTWR